MNDTTQINNNRMVLLLIAGFELFYHTFEGALALLIYALYVTYLLVPVFSPGFSAGSAG